MYVNFKNVTYSLHAVEQLAAFVIGDVKALLTEVSREELRETGDCGCDQVIIWILAGEGWLEQDGTL